MTKFAIQPVFHGSFDLQLSEQFLEAFALVDVLSPGLSGSEDFSARLVWHEPASSPLAMSHIELPEQCERAALRQRQSQSSDAATPDAFRPYPIPAAGRVDPCIPPQGDDSIDPKVEVEK